MKLLLILGLIASISSQAQTKDTLPMRYCISQKVTCDDGTWMITTVGIDKKAGTCCPLYSHTLMVTSVTAVKMLKIPEYNAAMDGMKEIILLSHDGWDDKHYDPWGFDKMDSLLRDVKKDLKSVKPSNPRT